MSKIKYLNPIGQKQGGRQLPSSVVSKNFLLDVIEQSFKMWQRDIMREFLPMWLKRGAFNTINGKFYQENEGKHDVLKMYVIINLISGESPHSFNFRTNVW